MTPPRRTQRFRTMSSALFVGAHRLATARTTGRWPASRVCDRCAAPASATCRENSCSVFTSVIAAAAVHFRRRPDVDTQEKAIPERRSSSELETTPRGPERLHRALRAWLPRGAREAATQGRCGAAAQPPYDRSGAVLARGPVRRTGSSRSAEESGHLDQREFDARTVANARNQIGSRPAHGHYSMEAAIGKPPGACANAKRNGDRSHRLQLGLAGAVCCFPRSAQVSAFGEEADQHPVGRRRREAHPRPAPPGHPRVRARVHQRGRARRGHAAVDPPAQGRARPQRPQALREAGRSRPPRRRLIAAISTGCSGGRSARGCAAPDHRARRRRPARWPPRRRRSPTRCARGTAGSAGARTCRGDRCR